MSKTGRDLAGNALFGFLAGFLTRKGFDHFNQKQIMRKYLQTGEIPTRKSMFMSIFLTLLFGGFGLFYIAPRTAIPFAILEIMMFAVFFGVLNFLFRPVVLFVAWIATLSYNKMILHLFGEYGGDVS